MRCVLKLLHFSFCSSFLITDGLVDCEDPECCLSAPECGGKQLCTSVQDPSTLIGPSSSTLIGAKYHYSFWERVKFLVHETNGIQRYAKVESFNEK